MIALHNPPFIDFVYSHGFVFYVIPKLLKLLKTAENGEIYGTLGGISTAVSLTRESSPESLADVTSYW